MSSRLQALLALAATTIAVALAPRVAVADDSFREDSSDHGFFFEMELDGGVGPRISPTASLLGHAAARARLGVRTRARYNEDEGVLGNLWAGEVIVHQWLNARPWTPNGDSPDWAVGISPRSLFEQGSSPVRHPSLMSIALPEGGIYIANDEDPVLYLGWSHAVSVRLTDRADFRVSADLRASVYFLLFDRDDATVVSSLSVGLTMY